jgi:hypothetical protein
LTSNQKRTSKHRAANIFKIFKIFIHSSQSDYHIPAEAAITFVNGRSQ